MPAICTIAAILLALLTLRVDRGLEFPPPKALRWLLIGLGPDGVRGVLSAIATSIITVTGVVFSITIVVLQLASTQFSPRVLRTFTRDRATQLVFGVFVGTFLYSLLILRTVRSSTDWSDEFIPSLSVTTAMLLVIASIGLLIYFIDNIAQSIRVTVLTARIFEDGLAVVHRLTEIRTADSYAARHTGAPVVLRAERSGYVQAFDVPTLCEIARAADAQVRIRCRVGDFVRRLEEIAELSPGDRADSDVEKRLHSAIIIGDDRTVRQDLLHCISQLCDIAVRALSPGVNDPTTARIAIDYMSAMLSEFGRHPPDTRYEGSVVIEWPTFDECLRAAYSPIRRYGAAEAHMVLHAVASLDAMSQLVDSAVVPSIIRVVREFSEDAEREIANLADRAEVGTRISDLLARLQAARSLADERDQRYDSGE